MHTAKRRTASRPSGGTRIMILDDHPVVRQGLADRIALEMDMTVCAEAATTREAMDLIEGSRPDVILVDLSLDDGSGLDLVKTIKARDDEVKCLVVSSHEEKMYAERCVRAGARGFVHKSEAVDTVIDAIRRVMSGQLYLCDAVAARTLQKALWGKKEPSSSPLDSLSDRELQVFELLGQGKTVREIAAALFLSHKTIETYRMNLKRKLSLRNSSELTRHAVQWALNLSVTSPPQAE